MLAPVNGTLLNGGRFALVFATATIACSAALAAQAIFTQGALAPTPATGSFVAVPTYIHHTKVDFSGVGEVYPAVTHNQSAGADIASSVNFRGLVARSVNVTASFAGYANVLAIPTSVLGQATVSPASATVLVGAIKIQHGRSALENTATVTLQAEPLVNRVVVADVMGASAQVYAESAINKVGEAYAYFAATGQLQSSSVGLVTRHASATLLNSAETTAKATHVKHSQATYAAGGYTVVGEPYLTIGGLVFLTPHAEVAAVAIQQALPLSALGGSGSASGKAAVRHGSAAAAFLGSANSVITAVRTTSAAATTLGAASLTAAGLRNVHPESLAQCAAQCFFQGLRTIAGEAQILTGAASLVAVPAVTVRLGAAAFTADADTQVFGAVFRMVLASVAGNSNAIFSSTRQVCGLANMDCMTHLAIAPITNPFSYDSDERTFFRSAQVVDFVRPSQITEFRRLA